jgi:aryl-alcohol dehydrogenase-like predicted oxidoreductase
MVRLALGTAQLGMDYGIAGGGRPSPDAVQRILAAAVDIGVRYFDTACAYGDAERAIGMFLTATRPSDLRVGTKLPQLQTGLGPAELRAAVMSAVDASRRRLGVETIDDLLIHSADNLREYAASIVDVLVGCIEQGLVRRIGVSVYDLADADLAASYAPLVVLQFPFNVFNRRFGGAAAVDRLRAADGEAFARSVLLQGLLVQTPDSAESAVSGSGAWMAEFRRVCASAGMSPLTAAVAFAAARSGADCLVVGVESVAQLFDVAAALHVQPAAGVLDLLSTRLSGVPRAIHDPRAWRRVA